MDLDINRLSRIGPNPALADFESLRNQLHATARNLLAGVSPGRRDKDVSLRGASGFWEAPTAVFDGSSVRKMAA